MHGRRTGLSGRLRHRRWAALVVLAFAAVPLTLPPVATANAGTCRAVTASAISGGFKADRNGERTRCSPPTS
jgi:hypothetical protein